jgi:hypothetical protein
MVTKDELKHQAESWKGYNKYLYDEARGKLKDKDYEVEKPPKNVKKPLPTRKYYKDKTVKELRVIAKSRGIPNYYKLKEDELIDHIMKGDKSG